MRQPKLSLMRMNADSFTLLCEFTEVVDRLFALSGCCTVGYPDVRIQRRNGIIRISVTLPNVHVMEPRAYVCGKALILEGQFESSGERFRREIPLPPGIAPSDVTTRFWEGMLALEFPFVTSRPVMLETVRHFAASG
jgi:HSP20 family molecular chaperone IbpA